MSTEETLHRAAREIRDAIRHAPLLDENVRAILAAADRVERCANERSWHKPALRRPGEEWVQALLAQAGAELGAARRLAERDFGSDRAVVAVFAMLLQMVFEKIAKAALARKDFALFAKHRHSHATASRMFAILKNQKATIDLYRRWKKTIPIAIALHRAHPAIAKLGPHLEYPWELDHKVALPASDLELVATIADVRGRANVDLVLLADQLIQGFDQLFV